MIDGMFNPVCAGSLRNSSINDELQSDPRASAEKWAGPQRVHKVLQFTEEVAALVACSTASAGASDPSVLPPSLRSRGGGAGVVPDSSTPASPGSAYSSRSSSSAVGGASVESFSWLSSGQNGRSCSRIPDVRLTSLFPMTSIHSLFR